MKTTLAAVVAVLGFMLLGAGLTYGLVPSRVAPGTSCGSAFFGSDSSSNGLTDTGEEACEEARTGRLPAAWALIAAGAIGLVGAGLMTSNARGDEAAAKRRAQLAAIEAEDAAIDPVNPPHL